MAGLEPSARTTALDVAAGSVALTEQLVDIPSVSGAEVEIADAVESVLRKAEHLHVVRIGNTLVARTDLGLAERVAIAGHLDTVPVNDNLPSRRKGDMIHGLGSCDMKSGVAVALVLAATVTRPTRDVTYLFYECEEVDARLNGLTILAAERSELLSADFAVLMEPSNAVVEAGCQGTVRVRVTTYGERAHSARSWMGSNAIHAVSDVLERLHRYTARRPVIDGLTYREGLNAVGVEGGVAGNVVPDRCDVIVNYRFAPDRSVEDAIAFVRHTFEPFEVEVLDSAPGALPGLSVPAAAAFVAAVGGEVNPKYGWTDVARFSGLGVPAVNFGPGDPVYAHRQDERVPIGQIETVEGAMRSWLEGGDD